MAQIGGIVGKIDDSSSKCSIENCANTGSITNSNSVSNASTKYTGGIVGYLKSATVTNCYNTGAITANSSSSACIGGIAGYAENTTISAGTSNDTYNSGVITASGSDSVHAGGIVGYAKDGSITGNESYSVRNSNKVSVTNGLLVFAGGIIGVAINTTMLTTSDIYNSGFITVSSSGSVYIGGIVGCINYESTTILSNCYNDGRIDSLSNSSDSFVGGIAGYAARTNIYANTSDIYNSGIITADGSANIYAGGIIGYAEDGRIIGSESYTVYNSNNVSADPSYNKESYAGGIAGYLNNTVISGVSSKRIYNNGNIKADSSYSYAGGIAGKIIYQSISYCNNNGHIISNSTLGGITGINEDSSIFYCTNLSDFSNDSSRRVGGITGLFSSTSDIPKIENCSNEGKISSSYDICTIGGIAGSVNGTTNIINCRNYIASFDINIEREGLYGSTGSASVGGIVGGMSFESSVNIEKCFNNGSITIKGWASIQAGGILGSVSNTLNGSFESSSVEIKTCRNSGNITAETTSSSDSRVSAGGIVGEVSSSHSDNIISNCYNSGYIKTQKPSNYESWAGGIVGGIFEGYLFIQNCYNVGEVISSWDAGGIGGNASGDGCGLRVESCYALKGVVYRKGVLNNDELFDWWPGGTYFSGGYKTEEEMKTYSTYNDGNGVEDWDFVNIWGMFGGYPYLR